MKNNLLKILILTLWISIVGCFEDQDDNGVSASEINDFVWKGLNAFYLYKDSKPDLGNNRFDNDTEYASYLNSFSSPEQIFQNLLYQPETVDEFSVITDDYITLEELLNGTSVSNGMVFRLYLKPNSNTEVFGIVRYVLPNTTAQDNGILRGDVFDILNGSPLTINNFNDLNNLNDYSITLASYNNNGTPEDITDDAIIPGSENVNLSKTIYTENPIFKTEIINVDGNNVGYLMYNGFTSSFDSELNDVFGDFMSANITDLVLDLRYNSGGSVNTAIALGSMITGQFTNDIFLTQEWNNEWQAYFEENEPESLINQFSSQLSDGTSINNLNLNKVYVLTTGSTASASELIINCLEPYIEVVQIGDNTRGKYQASVVIYDSDDFGRDGANPNHTYAMLPLIFKTLNKDGRTDYFDGLEPTIVKMEDFANMGVLGDENETFLAEAIANIQGTNRTSEVPNLKLLKAVEQIKFENLIKETMYTNKKLPKRKVN